MESLNKKYDFKKIEEKISSYWDKEKLVEKTTKKAESKPKFTFLEGPPTANAPPGLHHVQSRLFKDLVCRFNYMKGFSVPRKGGWDCHGLPVEVQIEKKIGLKTKKEVLDYGIGKFNKLCREDVFTYIKDWDSLTKRMAFWIDIENPYVTMTNEYIESVWWSLKELYNKKLLYEAHKVVPYCPRCETPLSSHEVALGYKDVKEDSITTAFKLEDEDRYLLAWTTTPWTTPANIALAVGEDIIYSVVEKDGKQFVLAKELVNKYFKNPKIIEEFAGEKLIGKSYVPLFDYYKGKLEQPAWKVIAADYVKTEEGTGIVHQAPAFGEEDYENIKKEGMAFVQPVDESGRFTNEIKDFKGKFVKGAEPEIINFLDEKGSLFKVENYEHSYPFCWRCSAPLLYYALESWFVKVTEKKKRLIELNQQIKWYPEHIKNGRFGKWLDNVKDWALSRNKFWGTPLPIWKCEPCKAHTVIGSVEELQMGSDQDVKNLDLHKPSVDSIKINCGCGKKMTRVPYVIDTWYDSGAASFAQFHYPFENKESFEKAFPYSFITEGVDQTRGWFYTLHVLSTLLFDKVAYERCVVSGLVVDEKGEKMSKSKGNIFNPFEVFDTIGVDAVRLQFCSVSAENAKRFSYDLVRENVMPFITTLWNVCLFFKEIEVEKDEMSDLKIEDKWINSKADSLIKIFTEEFEENNYHRCFEEIKKFVVEDFSRWYVRLVRERQDDAVVDTMKNVLEKLSKLLAPYTPYLSEFLWLEALEKKESVHLSEWPKPEFIEKRVEAGMESAREITQSILSIREKIQRGVRWPIKEAFIVSKSSSVRFACEKTEHLIKLQANVKKISLESEFKEAKKQLKPDYAKMGPVFGKDTPKIIAKIGMRTSSSLLKILDEKGQVVIETGDDKHVLKPEHFITSTSLPQKYDAVEFSEGVIYINKELTEAMQNEGMAREVLRVIQQSRKEFGLTKSVPVKIWVVTDLDTIVVVKPFFNEEIIDKIKASEFSLSEKKPEGLKPVYSQKVKNAEIKVFIQK